MKKLRKVKSLLAMAICAILLLSAVGCGPKGGSAILDDQNVNDKGIFPIVKEEITLTALIGKFPQVEDMDTNYATKWIYEKTGIHLDFQVVDVYGVAERLNPMLNSSSVLPDLIIPGPWYLDNNSKYNYGLDGVFYPLNDLIEKYGVELKRLWEEVPSMQKQMTSPDGNIYALTNYADIAQTQYGAKTYINRKFLDNLGLEKPTTLKEFENVLTAFKEKDANRNGDKTDEIPLTGYVDFNEFWIYLMNSFIYCDNGLINLDEQGNVYAPFIRDEWREGLKYIRSLYQKDLIDKEIFTQNQTAVKNLVNGNYVRPGVITAVGVDQFATFGSEQFSQYEILQPLLNTETNRKPTTSYYPPQASGGTFIISKNCKYVEAAYRLGDFLLSDEAQKVLFFGEEGVDWVEPEEGELGIDGKQATIKPINLMYAQNLQNKAWLWSAPQIDIRITDGAVAMSEETIDSVYYEWASQLMDYAPASTLPQLTFSSEDMLDASILRGGIISYVQSSVAYFVVGEMDIFDDGDWAYYLEQFDTLGLEELLRLDQEAYNNQYK